MKHTTAVVAVVTAAAVAILTYWWYLSMKDIQIVLLGELTSVGIDLKKLGGQLPKCLKFCPGIEVYGRFSLTNERLYTCTGGSTHKPQQFQPSS